MRAGVPRFLLCSVALAAAGCGGSNPASPTPRIPALSPVAAVILTPQLDTAAWIDASVHFSVSVQDSAGNPVTSGTVAWSSSDPAVAGIASDGTATARKNGVSHIVASAGGKADTATLVVRQRTSSIAVTPDSARLAAVGDTLRFAAAPTDRTGHPVAGAVLVWSVSDSGEAGIDSAGLLTARAFGRVGVTAFDTSSRVSGAAAVRITDMSPPAIDTVSPFPLLAGHAATITGQAFDASMPGDTVWVDGAPAVVTTASSTSLQITVPTYDCLPARTVVVRLATGGGVAQDSAGLVPSQSPVSLAPGHQEVIKNPADFCLQFTQGYGFKPYLVGVESLSPVGSSLTTVRFTAVAGWSSSVTLTDRVPAPPRTSVAPRSPLARRIPGGRAWARGPESRIRTWERTHLTGGSALASRGARPASGLRPLLSVSAGVAVGDTVQVRVPDVASTDPCANYTQIGATVEAVGSHAIVVADTGNPEYGFIRSDYQELSDALDTKIFTTDSAYFGAPSDLDGNGKIVAVFTRVLNQVDPSVVGGILEGFVFLGDLFPRTSTSGASCASSDEGEYFYGRVADPQGFDGLATKVRDARAEATKTMAHELVHLIQFGRRLQANLPPSMAPSMAEAQAVLGEEVVGDAETGRQPYQNYGYDVAFSKWGSDSIAWYADKFEDLFRYFGFQGTTTKVPGAPEQCGWWQADPSPCIDRPLWYGVGWSFLRWLSDRYGPSYPGGEQGLQRALILDGGTGPQMASDVVGVPLSTLMAKWSAALYTDDRISGLDSALTFSSWDLDAIDENIPAVMGLKPDGLDYGNWVRDKDIRAGSTGYIGFDSEPRPAMSLKVRRPDGGILPSYIQMWIVRMGS